MDISDRDAVFDTFERYRPDVVFHAAAHKHVPVLEHHPIEAAKTNVLGTLNVVDAAAAVGHPAVRADLHRQGRPPVERHGRLEAAGRTDRCWPDAPEGGAYCTVRFGNVLGSRGSVIPTFARQIAQGGPVTVTDPG